MRPNFLAILLSLLAALSVHGQAPAPIWISPTSSANISSAGVAISYTLPVQPQDGTVQLIFSTNQPALTLTLTNGTNVSFLFDPHNPLTPPAVTSVSPTGAVLLDGLYSMTLSYQDTNGDEPANVTITNVLVDTVTLPPILSAPSDNAVVSAAAALQIAYQLGESPLPGSVSLVFQSASTNITIFLDDNLTNNIIVSTYSLTDSAAIVSNTSPVLPDGTYTATLYYQDAFSNAIAFAQSTNILVDTITLPPVLSAPANSSAVSAATGLNIAYQLGESPLAGSVTLFLQSATTNVTLTLNNNLTNNFTVSTQSLTNSPAVVSATSPVLPDGRYFAILSYQDALTNGPAIAVSTNILVDTFTQAPLLTAPSNNAAVSSAIDLQIAYRLGESPLPGSVSLAFQSASTNVVLFLNNNLTNNFTVSAHSLTNSTAVVSATSPVLPDGTYAATMSYQDALGNPAKSARATNILVDTVTLAPTLSAPAGNSIVSSATGLQISYQLGESPLSNSVAITFQGASTNITVSLNNNLSNNFTVSAHSLTNSSAVLSATSPVLPDGTYITALSYQDALGNPTAVAQATNILVDTITLPPVLIAPVSGAVLAPGNSVPVQYALPETPFPNSVRLSFSTPQTNVSVFLNSATANSFSLNPTNLTGAPAVVSASAPKLPDGNYSVTLSYQDYLGNPVASGAVTNVLIVPQAPGVTFTSTTLSNGLFRFQFTNSVPGYNLTYRVLSSSNILMPLTNWIDLGVATSGGAGLLQFIDPRLNNPSGFYTLKLQ